MVYPKFWNRNIFQELLDNFKIYYNKNKVITELKNNCKFEEPTGLKVSFNDLYTIKEFS